jgi:hypothetical protein
LCDRFRDPAVAENCWSAERKPFWAFLALDPDALKVRPDEVVAADGRIQSACLLAENCRSIPSAESSVCEDIDHRSDHWQILMPITFVSW